MGLRGKAAICDSLCELIKILLTNKKTIYDLSDELNLSQRAVKRYLLVLERHFIVEREVEFTVRKVGNNRFLYSLSKGNGRALKIID